MEQTVWKGRRWSAANAYLRPALQRGNVRIVSGLATRVVIAEGRATGVELLSRGMPRTVAASREVILSASSINTPKLLMLSGIGPAAHLAEHGIEVVADRPGVGANLQDHLELYIQIKSLKPVTLYSHYNYVCDAADRPAVAPRQGRARHLEPVRERGLRPLGPRRRVPRHPVPLPAARRALRRPRRRSAATASRHMSGRCARPRAARCG